MESENIEKKTSQKLMRKWQKGLLIGCFGVVIIVIIVIVAIFIFLRNLFGPPPPNKEQLKSIVINNKQLFSQAVNSIKKLDKNIFKIDDSKYFQSQKNPNIKGLFAEVHTSNGYNDIPFKNQTIEELFNRVKVIHSIEIHDNCIDFYCGGIFRDYGCSIIWSADNKHFVWAGSETEDIIKGSSYEWKEIDGDNRRYIERIDDKWYFYEESF